MSLAVTGRETLGVLPLPAPGRQGLEESIASGGRLAVDWTLRQGHGLCANIVPELIGLGPDGYPALADAADPMHLRGRAQRAVRRCPAPALRIEQAAAEHPALPPVIGRKALDSGRY
ncbi:hypothetical protein GCM10010207_09730 [Streptomyces atratus]|nr:hypothetical protein GCM10010207_09730 [Streptomyces atratus]